MSRLFYHTMQDNAGNLLFNVSGTMRLAGSGTLATIYGDEALTVILANPMTNHPSFGSFKCFLGAGDYDFYMAKAGYTFETLTGVQGHGTMAQQDAGAVAITGGSATNLALLSVFGVPEAGKKLTVGGDTWFWGHMTVNSLNVNGTTGWGGRQVIGYLKASQQGLSIRQLDQDATGSNAVLFLNTADSPVGAITTTATTTTYGTTSDARLKHAITPLAGALDVVRALNPVAFRWQADGSRGRGFLAHEVAEVVDGVITGERDAVDDAGQIVPQMIDYSKLVPYLIGAVKELTQQVEMLTAQLAHAGA